MSRHVLVLAHTGREESLRAAWDACTQLHSSGLVPVLQKSELADVERFFGAVDTPMYQEVNSTPEQQAWITNLHALKRVGRPEDIARSVLYLASDDSAFVTGTASLIDGGLSITRT